MELNKFYDINEFECDNDNLYSYLDTNDIVNKKIESLKRIEAMNDNATFIRLRAYFVNKINLKQKK